jgi:anaerobic magnesium-protoporphyrin IX monomethyl ester cyclase
MKIVFIQPRGRTIYSVCPEPPLGLAYLASSLREYDNDLEIEIIDGFILDHDEYRKKIFDIKADIVGVTTTMSLLNEALKIPNMVKEKNMKFIIGGPGAANILSSRLYECGYSIICYGEGERTIVDLVKAFENKLPLKDVNGISFLSTNREIKTSPRKLIENLDEIPFPARDLLDMKKYINTWKDKMGVALSQIVSSRGCQYSCRFCDRAVFGRKIRFFSPTRVIEEMRILYDRYNVEMVYFEEDLFTLNKKRVLDFCDSMEKELPGKKWGAYSRVETVDLEMLNRMKLAGCTDLVFGAENGSQRLLDFLGKGITVEQIKKAFRWVHEVGINAGMFLILGIPGETQKDIDMTKKLIAECEPSMINLYFLTPIPGTEIFELTEHLIRNDVDFYNFDDLYGGVYKKDAFEIDPLESYKEVLSFFLNAFKHRVDPRLSLYDGTFAAGIGVV